MRQAEKIAAQFLSSLALADAKPGDPLDYGAFLVAQGLRDEGDAANKSWMVASGLSMSDTCRKGPCS